MCMWLTDNTSKPKQPQGSQFICAERDRMLHLPGLLECSDNSSCSFFALQSERQMQHA